MPRVPTAEGFGVLPGIRSGGARPVLSVEQAAQPGRQMEARGEQMVQIGGLVGDYAQQQQERVNRARVQDAYVQAQNFGREIELEQRKLTGQSAVGSTEAFSERYNKRISELAQDLSPIAQEAFRAKADALYGGFLDRGTKYEADQFEVYEGSVIDATLMASMQDMQVYKDVPDVFDKNRQDAKDAARMKASRAGLSDAAADQFVQAQMGKMHLVIIDNMLDGGDPMGAKAYFAQVSEDFLPTDAEAASTKVNKGAAAAEAIVTVDTLLAEMPLTGTNIPRADMDKWLRETISDPVQLKAARDELAFRVATHEEQYNNGQAEAFDTALNIATTRGMAAARGTAAFQALDTKSQLAIQDTVETRQETRRARADAAESRETSKRNETRNETFYDIVYTESGLKMLESMTPASVRMLRSSVGERNFGALLETYNKLKEGPERVYEATIDNNTFDAMAIRYGYDPLSKNADDKLAIVQLRATVQTAIAAEQDRIGNKLTPIEKQKVVESVFATGAAPARVPVTSGLFGDRVSMTPIDQLTAEQAASIKVENIPYAERLQIVSALGKKFNATQDPRFDPANPDNVRAMYLAMRGVGVAND
jgi:hypothetical protein